MGKWERAFSQKVFNMCTKNIIYDIKSICTTFGQKTVEFYDNDILLTIICIFGQNFGWNHAMLHYM